MSFLFFPLLLYWNDSYPFSTFSSDNILCKWNIPANPIMLLNFTLFVWIRWHFLQHPMSPKIFLRFLLLPREWNKSREMKWWSRTFWKRHNKFSWRLNLTSLCTHRINDISIILKFVDLFSFLFSLHFLVLCLNIFYLVLTSILAPSTKNKKKKKKEKISFICSFALFWLLSNSIGFCQ